MPEMYETLLKKILEEKGVSLYILSRLTGISRQSLSNYANGKREPDIPTAVKIIKALQLDEMIIYRLFEPCNA